MLHTRGLFQLLGDQTHSLDYAREKLPQDRNVAAKLPVVLPILSIHSIPTYVSRFCRADKLERATRLVSRSPCPIRFKNSSCRTANYSLIILRHRCCVLKDLRTSKDKVEARINEVAESIASDLGLQMDKSIRLEWYKVANTRTRCMRITQVNCACC